MDTPYATRRVVGIVGLTLPPAPMLPYCHLCDVHAAVVAAVEHFDRGHRVLMLCGDCLRDRTLVWERFVVQVNVASLDGKQQSS